MASNYPTPSKQLVDNNNFEFKYDISSMELKLFDNLQLYAYSSIRVMTPDQLYQTYASFSKHVINARCDMVRQVNQMFPPASQPSLRQSPVNEETSSTTDGLEIEFIGVDSPIRDAIMASLSYVVKLTGQNGGKMTVKPAPKLAMTPNGKAFFTQGNKSKTYTTMYIVGQSVGSLSTSMLPQLWFDVILVLSEVDKHTFPLKHTTFSHLRHFV